MHPSIGMPGKMIFINSTENPTDSMRMICSYPRLDSDGFRFSLASYSSKPNHLMLVLNTTALGKFVHNLALDSVRGYLLCNCR